MFVPVQEFKEMEDLLSELRWVVERRKGKTLAYWLGVRVWRMAALPHWFPTLWIR
jgi:hypothetical protein